MEEIKLSFDNPDNGKLNHFQNAYYINFRKATHHEKLLPKGKKKWEESLANPYLIFQKDAE